LILAKASEKQAFDTKQSQSSLNKDVEEARKAVYEKNKIISDMFNK
jgi:hypothetical protein